MLVILHPYDNKYTVGSNADGRTFVSNFNTYKTEGRVKIELSNTTMTLPQGSGKLKVQTDVTNNYNPSGITSERVLDPTYGAINFTIIPNGPDGLAFINDLRDRNSTYEGEYEMTAAEDNGPKTRIFLSYNSVAGGHKGHYDATGDNKTKKALLKPNFKLILNGVSASSSSNKVLIGLEHQIIRQSLNPNSTSFLDNQGEIILNNGKNLVGIMIDVEAINNLNHIPSITQNNGKITINSEKSVGIDYGSYSNLKLISTLKIGNIDVNGTGNVGFRMFNIHPNNMNYFDNITADSGGTGKEILVKGQKNIGIAIVKSLSDSKNANPIANLTNLNVTVDGGTDSAGDPISENVGFLRHKDYSTNNKNAMIFDSFTMGDFKFGNNAFKSTLIRSDKYNIELQKDITITDGHANGENTIGFANDDTARSTIPNTPLQTKIINKAKLTASNQKKFRGLVANGKNAAVENVRTGTTGGIINITGDKDESIGMAAIAGANLKTDGIIQVTGTGIKKVGVYNDGDTAEIGDGSEITVHGSESAAIYNKKTTNITGNTTINAKNGTIGIFSTGSGKNVTFTSTTPSHKVTINVDDSNIGTGLTRGLAVYATDNSDVQIKKAEIDVEAGNAGLVATDGASINIEGGKLRYKGNGFAMYTGESGATGTINAKNTTVTLEGKAVGFEVTGNTSHVNLTGSTVNINSDDVILMHVSNPSTLQLSNFDTTLNSISGLTNPIGGTSTKYKLAVITGLNDGNSFKINSLLDKNDAISNTTSQTYKFIRNILIQKSILDVDNNVKSILTSANATTIGESSVYGLAISSTKGAATNAETGINVNSGNSVIADRIDSGNGAIGLYTNFGTININNGGKVLVETDDKNIVNNRGVGIFAVNGSKVNNKGNVEVSGEEAIGILGLAYRQNQLGDVVGNEFESGNEGKIKINNYKNIILNSANAKGIYIKNNTPDALELSHSGTSTEADNVATNLSGGVITMKENGTSGNASVAMFAEGATIINDTGAKIDLQGTSSQIGMYGITNNTDNSVLVNRGTITVGASTGTVPNVGMFSNNTAIIPEQAGGLIDIKDNSYGIYGKSIKMTGGTIKTANNGVGIFATGPSVNLLSGTINVGNKQSVGVFIADDSTPVTTNITGNVNMTIGDNSFGYVITSTTARSQLTTGNSTTATVNEDSVYAYSANPLGKIVNNTNITSTGNKNYALYGNGTIENHGIVDFTTGVGNVAVYSTGGTATNFNKIKVGATNALANEFGLGMATGYYDKVTETVSNEGTIINRGIIEVSHPHSMGMYAVGANSKAINYGSINLSGDKVIGMYLDHGAVGENWGIIQTTAGGFSSVKGVYLANGSYIKNYGTIKIEASDAKSSGIWTDNAENVEENAQGINPINNKNQTGTSTPVIKVVASDDMKEVGGVTIKVPPRTDSVTITDVNGNTIPMVNVSTNVLSPSVPEITVTAPSGITTLNLDNFGLKNYVSTSEVTSFGMYVDTSGIQHTNPIQGLNNLANLEDINLYFGPEATKYTTAKAIELGDDILAPYNSALAPVVIPGTILNITSSSLTWMVQPTKNKLTGLLDKVYLVKVPYTAFATAKDTDTQNFLAGLEEKYGIQGLGTTEKKIFDKLNGITSGEANIFAQAVDEMKGFVYSNIQQRTKETGDILNKEFDYLQDKWRNPSKQNNKIKVFGQRKELKTNTGGVIDYTSNAYGVAYVHENETFKLGSKSGWYAGSVYNKFKFKDIGKSQEEQTMVKVGLFKTMSPKNDYNGSLTWKISGEVFTGRGEMKCRSWIIDEAFETKSDYITYGVALKNEIGKDFRTSERTSIKPYGALNLEYGKYSNIKEDGPMALEIKGNNYFSVQPELGVLFNYSQPVGARSLFKASFTAAYTNELGKVNDVRNEAKLRETTVNYYKLRGDKENKKGNGKFDLNIGIDNTRFGVTINAGYDTKGNNVRGGIGFRIIY